VRNLIATRPGPGRRHTLFNDKFTIRHCDGEVERHTLRGAEEIGGVFARYFGITTLDPAEIAVGAGLAEERAAHPDFFDR